METEKILSLWNEKNESLPNWHHRENWAMTELRFKSFKQELKKMTKEEVRKNLIIRHSETVILRNGTRVLVPAERLEPKSGRIYHCHVTWFNSPGNEVLEERVPMYLDNRGYHRVVEMIEKHQWTDTTFYQVKISLGIDEQYREEIVSFYDNN